MTEDLHTRWCRFCKLETQQWVSEKDPHARVCITCWRRQNDGARIEIEDGASMSQPPRRDSTIPPPPLDAGAYVRRDEWTNLLRRVAKLEEITQAHGDSLAHLEDINSGV